MAWTVLGHEWPIQLLREALAQDRLPQSLLLSGPRQVGKRTLALDLARLLNCTGAADLDDPSREPCGACRACRLSGDGGYPDVHPIELREGRQKIGIRDIQVLQAELARRPVEDRRRVAILTGAERLSTDAENCLLKTLEEPPPHAVIILTADEAESLLPTTVSRCRRVRLRPVAAARIAEHLVDRYGLSRDEAGLLAALSQGRPGWAIAAAREPGRLDRYHAARERLRRLLEGSTLTRLEIAYGLADGWSGKSEQVREELRVWSSWWRDLLLVKLGLTAQVVSVPGADLEREASGYSLASIRSALGTLVQARADLDQNVNPRLALDVALLNLPRRGLSRR